VSVSRTGPQIDLPGKQAPCGTVRNLCAQWAWERASSGPLVKIHQGKPLLRGRRLGDLNPGWARTQTALAVPSPT
jgi:hypothetical protein